MSDFITHLLPYGVCAGAYGAQAVVFWPGRVTSLNPGNWRLLPLLPWALHAWLVFAAMLAGGAVSLGLFTALSAVAALIVMAYAVAAWRYPLGGMQGVVLAIAAILVLLQGLFDDATPLLHAPDFSLIAHLLASLTAYSLFGIAALHALFILMLERSLHRHPLANAVSGLPPLLTLERLMFRLIQAGFAVLSLTLLSGVVFAGGVPLTHMTVFGMASWVIFGWLLLGRMRHGWRGRRAVYWTLGGFATLFLAYMGSQFVYEFLLDRSV